MCGTLPVRLAGFQIYDAVRREKGGPRRSKRAARGSLRASICVAGEHFFPSPSVTSLGPVDAMSRTAMHSQPDQRGVASAMNEPGGTGEELAAEEVADRF